METILDFFSTQEFAQLIYIDGIGVPGIFERQYTEYADVAGTYPTVSCPSNQVLSVKLGDLVEVEKQSYTIVSIQPDGAGLTLLVLNED